MMSPSVEALNFVADPLLPIAPPEKAVGANSLLATHHGDHPGDEVLLDGDESAEQDRQHDAVDEGARENRALLACHVRHRNSGCDILRRDHLTHDAAG